VVPEHYRSPKPRQRTQAAPEPARHSRIYGRVVPYKRGRPRARKGFPSPRGAVEGIRGVYQRPPGTCECVRGLV